MGGIARKSRRLSGSALGVYRWPGILGLVGMGLLLTVLFPGTLSSLVAVNLTPSLPRGLYRVTTLKVRPGSLVTFCLPPELIRRYDLAKWIPPGRCPSGKAPLCKRIVLVGPGSVPCGGAVRRVLPDQVFVRGESRNSKDSCVFGPVPVTWLRDGVVPVWTL
jgi:type IV secretory pathway protease TraF